MFESLDAFVVQVILTLAILIHLVIVIISIFISKNGHIHTLARARRTGMEGFGSSDVSSNLSRVTNPGMRVDPLFL